MAVLEFHVPDELLPSQVEALFDMWAEFVKEATNANHVPVPGCETCCETFAGYVRIVMGVAGDEPSSTEA
jgi:hypothetical protein